MIRKVLIAEDHESMNLSIQRTLAELNITQADYVYHCDDAFAKINTGVQLNDSYDLLITDLYFDDDGHKQNISGGADLISLAREKQPDLKILVFSAENRAATIKMLMNLNIDGYVCKGRNDAKELKLAIGKLALNQSHFPRSLTQTIRLRNAFVFSGYDITIINLLANGTRQKDIPRYLQDNNIPPFGLSSVEKRLYIIRDALEISSNQQLVAYCKDNGII